MRRHMSVAVVAVGLLAPVLPAVAITSAAVAAVAPTIAFAASTKVAAGGLLSVAGVAKPAVFGRSVQL